MKPQTVATGDDSPGRALRFFEMFDADDIAKLGIGVEVKFEAKLQEFLHKNGQQVMVAHCRVIP